MSEILGLTAVQATVIVCVVGVAFRITQGMQGKSLKEFNFNLAFTTFVIGVIFSIGLVAPVISNIPAGSTDLLYLTVIASQIATVMGVDATVRKGYGRVQQSLSKKPDYTKI